MTVEQKFNSFLDKLRPFITDYLQERGIDTTKNFSCLNPEHEDSNPSMTADKAEKNGYRAFCFSCGTTLDIFDIHAILEDKPRRGPGWMKEVVLPLAEKYGIRPPVYELSQKEQFCQDLYRVYNEIASMLNHDIDEMAEFPKEYIKEKQFSKGILEFLDIGTLSFEQLQERFEREDLERFGLNRPDIFSRENVLFTIRDEKTRAIRFFCRTPEKGKRWHSTSSSKLLVDIWATRGRLYLSHLLDRRLNYAILVEGQPAATMLTQSGFKNVVAACGTSGFTEAHANRLAFLAISEVIIIFDNDEAGEKGVEKLLKQDFVKKSGMKYSIVRLTEANDPDEFIRKYGKDKLHHLVKMRLSAFKYLLSKFEPDAEINKVCEQVLPYIATNKSEIARETMVRDLAKYLRDEVSVSAILADVKKLDDEVRNKIEGQQKLIIGAATREASNNTEQAIEIFREASERLENIEKETGGGQSLEGATMSRIQLCKQWEEADRSNIPNSFRLIKERMGNLDSMLSSSSWASGQLAYVAAVENMGKSSWINDLAWQIASREENRARVFMHTIDDSAEDLIRRMVCQAYGKPELTINMVANPQVFYEDEGISDVYEMREEAYARYMEVVADGRLFIKDATDGTSVAFAETQIKNIRRKYPDDNLVFFLDNFHNVTDWPTLDVRQKFTNTSKYLKRLATIYRCTTISTVEYRKTDPSKCGTNEDLAESRSMKFDAKLILHLFSDAHALGVDNAKLVHRHEGKLLPRVIARVGKSKVGSFKGDLFYDFYPASGLFFAVDPQKAKSEYEERVKELKQEND